MNVYLTGKINLIYILTVILILLVILIFILIISSIVENGKIRVNPYKIYSPKIPSVFNGYKILFISDLHNVNFGKDNDVLINRIEELNPDIILLGGDMFVGKPNRQTVVASKLVNTLSSKYSTYYAIGNHELRVKTYEKYGDMWKTYLLELSEDTNWLINEYIDITKDKNVLRIYGLDMDKSFYNRHHKTKMDDNYLNNTLKDVNNDFYNILIAHNPEYFNEYSLWGADLTLSGHNHGGIIYLPLIGGIISTRGRLFPKYDKGLFKSHNHYMILSSGLGSHTIKARFNNIPEIILLELYNDANEKVE